MKKFSILVLAILAASTFLYSQHFNTRISGILKDSETGKPVENANVFIANTFFGSSSDAKGYYEIIGVPAGTHEIMITVLGYEMVARAIKVKKNKPVKKNFTLKPKLYVLPPTEVIAEDYEDWYRDLRLFKELFFGQNDFAEECKLTNDHVMRFDRYDGKFRAKAEAPLVIFNYALGLRIRCILEDFTFQGSESKVSWTVKSFYKKLEPENEEQKTKWLENRRLTFNNSVEKFLLYLRNGPYDEEAYKITYYTRLPIHLLSPNEMNPTVPDSLIRAGFIPGEKVLFFENYLQIKIPQSNLISYLKLNYDEVTINEFGMTTELQPFNIYGYWSTKGMANQLPLYYYLENE